MEALRERGARYLIVPAAAFWWLTHYEGFAAHLLARYRVQAFQQDLCLVFSLAATEAVDPTASALSLAVQAAAARAPVTASE
jgi:hypothetical protein